MNITEKVVFSKEDAQKLTGEHIVIPEGFTEIDYGAFDYKQREMVKSITLPASFLSLKDTIRRSAFEYFTSLENIFVDKNNPNFIDIDGVVYSKDKTVLVKFPRNKPCENYFVLEGITTISADAFQYCINIKTIVLPELVTMIENGAFYNCESLININIPDSVTEIGGLAFCSCNSLECITLPESTYLPDKIFLHCHSLENFYISKTDIEPKYLSEINKVLFNAEKTVLIDYPIGRKKTKYVIPDGVKHISRGTFEEAGFLKTVVIPESVKSIGHNAFNNCWSLEKVNIPSGVTIIEHFTFYSCRNLKSIKIPHGVTVIGYQAFSSCDKLKKIVLPETVTTIEIGAFSCCYNLEAIVIPDSVVVIDMLANGAQKPEGYKPLVIYCRKNSVAHKYAMKHGLKHVIYNGKLKR